MHYRGAILLTGFDITYNWESRDANAYTTNFLSNWCEGGNISCGINATVSGTFDDVDRVGKNLLLRIYPALCSPNSFWEFCAMMNVSMSNFNVDVEGGNAVSFTLQGQYNINPGLCSTVNGYIVDPMNRFWAGAATT